MAEDGRNPDTRFFEPRLQLACNSQNVSSIMRVSQNGEPFDIAYVSVLLHARCHAKRANMLHNPPIEGKLFLLPSRGRLASVRYLLQRTDYPLRSP